MEKFTQAGQKDISQSIILDTSRICNASDCDTLVTIHNLHGDCVPLVPCLCAHMIKHVALYF